MVLRLRRAGQGSSTGRGCDCNGGGNGLKSFSSIKKWGRPCKPDHQWLRQPGRSV